MEKQKRWHLFLIIAVILLTVYNILPTVFYYTKPLKEPIAAKEANLVSEQIATRVNALEEDAKEWLHSFDQNLGLKEEKIVLDEKDPSQIQVTLSSPKEASLFRRILPRAGMLIPFVPAQLGIDALAAKDPKEVVVQRRIQMHFTPEKKNKYFTFSKKIDPSGQITPFYKDLVLDRVATLALAAGGESDTARTLEAALQHPEAQESKDALIDLARQIGLIDKTFGDSPVAKRYYASFTQTTASQKNQWIKSFQSRLEELENSLNAKKTQLSSEQKELQAKQGFADSGKEQEQKMVDSELKAIEMARAIIERNKETFASGLPPLTERKMLDALQTENHVSTFAFGNLNPYIANLAIDWSNDIVTLVLHPEVSQMRAKSSKSESGAYFADQANLLVVGEIARLSRATGESLSPNNDNYALQLNGLTGSQSFLALNLAEVAKEQSASLKEKLARSWVRENNDFAEENFPIYSYEEYKNLPAEQQKLGLVIFAPSSETSVPAGFKNGSLYVIAKGINAMVQQYSQNPESTEAKSFMQDFKALSSLLQQEGFFGYPANAYHLGDAFKQDFIFELDDYYSTLLKATRENFTVHGSKRYATLEFTDYEQRLLTLNRIEDRIHEDLLKWRDAYHAAQVDLNLKARFDVPPPTQNAFLSNLKLSAKKYFRGDDRKILKWGLDLSGGKTVRIGLQGTNGKPITNPDDLNEGVNELYKRVNKMGVSEVGIRIEGQNIILDFPGSQGLSASELVKASSMTFHVINEKFGPKNRLLADASNRFLQEVWNEAVVTGKKSQDEINLIAWQHLGGTTELDIEAVPQSEAAKALVENGLKLAGPSAQAATSAFNDTLSSIALFKGEDFSAWEGQTHPLMVVFHNYALEGAKLENIQVGYDPSKGNLLSFGVKGPARDDFYTWTSQFAEEKITGTPKENYSNGNGWRMAVILNGNVVSSPTLNSPLRDHAMITGHFSQREVGQLAADLKAGSLTFTPKILSEQNVSPELGQQERLHGIIAAVVATLLVIIAMVLYYRFAGIVASVAVLFLLLVIWGVMQNLDAALTLPSIAGVILTIGMAVDANVLVYERIREEFAISHRLPSAVQAGYRKAFSAIIDSNLTTIIAALILLQFDSGPIKGFAVTLIVGIVTSMFTSLFMTRTFFAGWVQNPKHNKLSMASLITKTSINFLAKAKSALIASLIVIVIGSFLLYKERGTILGMDFTGGFALTLDLPEHPGMDYRDEVSKALVKSGASLQDFQIRELNTPHHLRLQLGRIMEEPGHPFHGMPLEVGVEDLVYKYQKNPRIAWVIDSLQASGLVLSQNELATVQQNWSEMSGQFSDAMRNNAIIALLAALACILVYITVRFEFKYAISAIIGLAHDILITLALLAILHLMGVPTSIDLQVIAALMTIVGYSLNDTIIIFDRIREDVRIMRKSPFPDIVNHALNATLSRTIMTSGTTLLVLIALLILGGSTIFNFALVMTIGVVIGTLSSLYVAAPLLLYFHGKEAQRDTKGSIAKISAS